MADVGSAPVDRMPRFYPWWRRTALALLAVAAAGAAAAWSWPSGGTPDAVARPGDRSLSPLSRRDFVRRVRLTGLTEATRFFVVTTPLLAGSSHGSLVITRLAQAGSAVKAGDLLVAFDRQSEEKLALDKKSEYDDLVQQISQKQAEQEAARVKDESEIAQAEHAVASLELEVLKNEMLSRIKAQKNDQDLAEARAKLKALRDGFALKRAAAAADLRILEIRRDRARGAMEHAVQNAAAMTIVSPLDGLVVPKITWRGNGPADVQEGDDMWPGSPVLQVVNQSSMLVRARVNQADLPAVRPGLPAVVRLDAYPDLRMTGRVEQVAPIALSGSFSPRVRTFTAVVAIDGSNPRLLPDLTAAVDVEIERIRAALVVPRDAVHADGRRAYVRVRNGDRTVSREITLGPSDEVDVVATAGLEPGMVVVR
jgi:HlyD family secretion protein